MNISTQSNNRIFVDANYFVALFNPYDSLHKKAFTIASALEKGNSTLIITNFVFLEIVTVLSQKRGRAVAVEAGNYLLSVPTITTIHIDEALNGDSWNIFQRIAHKDISFVDCSILAVIRAESIPTLLTFDITDFKRLQKEYRFRIFPL